MDRVQTISVPTPFDIGPINCYVLTEGPLTVVDPGPHYEDAIETVTDGLADLGFDVAEVERILVTHPHLDHFGLASYVRERSGAVTYAHENALDRVGNFVEYFLDEREYFHPYLVSRGMPEEVAEMVIEIPEPYTELGPPLTVDESLSPGEEIDVGITLDCIDSPGHSPGSLSFFAVDHDYVFTGDHVLSHITPNPTLQIETVGEYARSLERYLDALLSLRTIDATRAYGGHGEPIPNLQARIDEIHDHHDRRMNDFSALIEDRPKSAYEVMHEAFDDLPVSEYFLGMSEVIGHLDLLRIRGRVALREREDGVLAYTTVDD